MGFETQNDVIENENKNEKNEENLETNGQVDLEGEHICVVNKIKKLVNKNPLLKEKLQ